MFGSQFCHGFCPPTGGNEALLFTSIADQGQKPKRRRWSTSRGSMYIASQSKQNSWQLERIELPILAANSEFCLYHVDDFCMSLVVCFFNIESYGKVLHEVNLKHIEWYWKVLNGVEYYWIVLNHVESDGVVLNNGLIVNSETHWIQFNNIDWFWTILNHTQNRHHGHMSIQYIFPYTAYVMSMWFVGTRHVQKTGSRLSRLIV